MYYASGRRNGMDLTAHEVRAPIETLAASGLLALVVVPGAFALVFAADYFFKTDFRVWVVAIKAFTPDKIAIAVL